MNLHAGGDACFTTDGGKVFPLQTFTSGLNASLQPEYPTKILISINKAMKNENLLSCGKCVKPRAHGACCPAVCAFAANAMRTVIKRDARCY